MGLQYLPTVGAVLQTQGSRKGVQYPARPLRGEWWGPHDPWTVLQARDIGPCEVAFNGGYCRGSNNLSHLVQRGGGSASAAFIMLELGARGGRRCITLGLNNRGGNDGVSLSCPAA